MEPLTLLLAATGLGTLTLGALHVFIPRLIELYKQGRFPFDKLIKFYSLDQINQAAADSEAGGTLKPVLRMA